MAYINTFITVAPDSTIEFGNIPESKRAQKTIHELQYELLTNAPYTYGHEDLIFEVYLIRKNLESLSGIEKEELWNELFSKGNPCLRASALTKKYGYGAHYNQDGKIAIYPIESLEYKQFLENEAIKKIPAMRTKRK